MHLRKAFIKKTGRTYLSIVQGYRDNNGKSKSKVIESLGYLDKLKEQYDDPVAHYTKIVDAMNKDRLEEKTVTVSINTDEQLERGAANRKNYGHVVFSKIYHELEIDRFLKNARRHENFKFNTDAIMRLLVYTRLLLPSSKRSSVLNKDRFFGNYRFTLDDVYNALTHFDAISQGLLKHLHTQVSQAYERQTGLVYYDVTNYYFEIDNQDELRRRGAEKNKRNDPIIQMGLLLDRNGLPISYKIFPGNTHDSQTLMPVLKQAKKDFGIGRIVVVADKALNSGDNIAYNTILGDGYIYSKSIRGGSKDFKAWVLDDAGYRQISDRYTAKSIVVPDAKTNVTTGLTASGRKAKTGVPLEQKWISYYSKRYALRAKHKRDEAIEKAIKMIKDPEKYKKAIDYGAAGYIKNFKVDKDTGEILSPKDILMLDLEKIAEDEKYDGYYAIATSELDANDADIIGAYHGLWRIEESFKVTKDVLGLRPIFLRTEEHINAHFLICFISLLIARVTELRLGGRYTIDKITETLRRVECSNIEQNLWLFDFADDVTDEMNEALGTDFGKKIMTLKDIRKNLGDTKKN